MDRQFTRIIVPIHNAQQILRERILHLMDVVSDLTNQFQIRIVDDHSDDSSLELAYELAQQFPQISVSEQPMQVGLSRAAEMEVSKIPRADFVFVHDITYRLRVSFFRRLWECRNQAEQKDATEIEEASRKNRIDPVHYSDNEASAPGVTEKQGNQSRGKANPYFLNPSEQFDVIQQLTETLNGK